MYDARNKTATDGSNFIFGAITLVVVCAAFLAAWKGPDLISGGSANGAAPHVAETISAPSGVDALARTPDEQRFLAVVSRLSPKAYREIETKLPGAGDDWQARGKVMFMASYPVFAENADVLANVSAEDIDQLLTSGMTGLETARRSGTKWCKGSFLAQFEGMSPKQAVSLLEREGKSAQSLAPVTMRMNADFFEMIERAKTNPVRHGKLTSGDEQALQGAMMSLMTDPTIMKAMMAGGDERAALKQLDLCSVGVTALKSFRALPADTKGRAWAAMFDDPKLRRALSKAKKMTAS